MRRTVKQDPGQSVFVYVGQPEPVRPGKVYRYQGKPYAVGMRDNCAACEGTGRQIDFTAIRNRKPLVPVFINRDPRGYALKIESDWMIRNPNFIHLHRDFGGYGILAPDFTPAQD